MRSSGTLKCLVVLGISAEERFNKYRQACCQCANRLRQSSLAHLKPPRPKTNARYMNGDPESRWGRRALWLLDRVRSGNSPLANSSLTGQIVSIAASTAKLSAQTLLESLRRCRLGHVPTWLRENIRPGTHVARSEDLTDQEHGTKLAQPKIAPTPAV